jgi:hypothetical protein
MRLFFILLFIFISYAQASSELDTTFDQIALNPLIAMDPGTEGIYKITLQCPRLSCDQDVRKSIDRLTVTHIQGPLGIYVTLSSAEEGVSVDSYYAVQVGPTAFSFTGSPKNNIGQNRFAYLTFTIDPVRRTITGSLMDARTVGFYPILGEALNIAADLVTKQPPAELDASQISGTYRGKYGKLTGNLIVQERPDHQMVGYFSSDKRALGAPLFALNFTEGTWTTRNGLLRLLFSNDRLRAEGQFVMSYKENINGRPVLQGFEYSTFATNSIKFFKVM